MRALPARLIAPGVLCAALLTGVTGPAAWAADTAPEHHRATTSAALLAQVRAVDADEHGLAPVVDLLKAVLEADDGRLPAAEARKLGEAAKEALAKAADEDPAATTGTTATSSVTTSDDTVVTVTGDELSDEELATLREAVDSLLDFLQSGIATSTDTDTDTDETGATTETDADTSATETPSLIDALLGRVGNLIAALFGTETQASILPAPAALTRTPILPGVTLPGVAPLTSVLLPA
ncbi:hypothetical protein [Streptomyces flaveolus]|uniref:hypothetical protein n=1 Tax=Streptomyces flaveolus TaxID=67297 RepID=UPI0016718086|nr:hypothetical protein [Streptomyces flaveolus]GGQ68198.1 hypothetical protein GCM10010216_32520 [Streptomyces flaveolus]